ncbi:MAG: hypothetical protein ACTTK2_01430 [Hoylesella marshii]|uniref:hypothetical protein n=1 Tax=Hoylesella marshii TaxID=189722 RepID=UPI003FA0DEF6
MNQVKLVSLALMTLMSEAAFAGGLLTNTNQNIIFLRNPARDGAIGIDGVYSNPAGVAFLGKGLHLSFNVQNAYQTRTIRSGITVPSLASTPYYQPFRLNGGNEDGVKRFKGTASVPIIPSIQAALNYDKWGFQAGFAIGGGGGKATFNDGLGSFERQIAMIPALLHAQGLTTTTPGYRVNSYINGQQYIFGLQLGATYKFNDHLAGYVGARFNYVSNRYEGSITDITANIGGTDYNLFQYFGDKAVSLKEKSALYELQATQTTDPAKKAALQTAAAQYAAAADQMDKTKRQFADKYLDCTQTGWGVTPIIGLDYKYKKLNVGVRYEMNTNLNIENNTKRDDTGLFKHGVNTPNDIPGLFTLGAQYEVSPTVRVMTGYHLFFDKNADMANDKQKLLAGNTQEFLAGAEWDISKVVQVSAGVQRTKYGLGNGDYLNDMSFVTSSYSIGFGAGFQISEKVKLNVAYFWTNYETFDKAYDSVIKSGASEIAVKNTDSFTRTNKVFGVGLDIDI